MKDKLKILFVCHGNICRSPMAEFVMKDMVRKEGLEEQVLPRIKDSAEEAVRVRQRRRWEKQHGLHEKK